MVNNIVLSAVAWASSLRSSIAERLKDVTGQDLLEYAVLAGAIAIVAGGVLFGAGAAGLGFNDFSDKIEDCMKFKAGCKPNT